jgi:flagellar basal-body rod modification protein FlgD
MANSSSSTSTSSTDSATISASDFLTLLVTELQNQDPTASTDPNEYVNQLVSVNSLEQLIDINQTLTNSSKSSNHVDAKGATGQSVSAATAASSTSSATQPVSASKVASGNLSVPAASPAAQRVANALNGQHASL